MSLKQTARVLEATLDDMEQEAWAGRYPATIHARAHLASMTPERRAQLEREWETPA